MMSTMSEHFDCEPDFLSAEDGSSIKVTKYVSKTSGLSVYFADVESPVINGYFCLGTDQPEAGGIEQLIHHLDSSGGLLPRPMRGDMLRPCWQFHGAENPLADRDQSCFVCCALGEPAFLGTFSCSSYLLQNIEAVMELHGFPFQGKTTKPKNELDEDGNPKALDAKGDMDAIEKDMNDVAILEGAAGGGTTNVEENVRVPNLDDTEYYLLSEAGEGAMAWEGTLQAMFPGSPAFYNRLLSDGKFNRLSTTMRKCYDRLYRPENLSVIITGTVKNRDHILEVLRDHETDFFESHQGMELPPFTKPWSNPLPSVTESVTNTAWFVCRNPMRKATPTVCIGWRGCSSTDFETSMAIKVLTAHLSVGPMWTKLVTAGKAHRISWCQLEYTEACSLVTIHGLQDIETANSLLDMTIQTIEELLSDSPIIGLKLGDIRAMSDRVGWHYIREFESEPYLQIAAAIAKAERYGGGSKDQVKMRMCPRLIFDALLEKPLSYWKDILQKFLKDAPIFCTKVLPKEIIIEEQSIKESTTLKEESSGDMNFAATSRRAASSRPRRSNHPVAQETSVAVEDEKRSELILPSKSDVKNHNLFGLLEEHLQTNPFPFGNFEEERKEFETRLEVTKEFLDNVTKDDFKSWTMATYSPDSQIQHPLFPLTDLPLYTFLEDTKTSFVYITAVLDTTHLDSEMRKMLPSVTAAIGAFVCPRPPGLDTDQEIESPNEFNPPMEIADSQVSIGLNGEMMQSIFLTLIVRPEKYAWTVGLLRYVLYESEFTPNFLKFVASEAARGLAANYKMQTAEKPNYDCFDSSEINLHSLIKQVYKEESNARLFVGRRRLDLMMEYIENIEKDASGVAQKTNNVWKQIVGSGKIAIQVAANVQELHEAQGDLVAPWKQYFNGERKVDISKGFGYYQPTLETAVMNNANGTGIAVCVNQPRLPCLNIAIRINPHNEDFPKLCMAAQLFSMAQKWIWNCWDLDDFCSPVIRMPCSYANLMSMNLESYDIIGSLKTMKMIMTEDWSWINAILIATKLMVVNDPATMEIGSQGCIASALLSHLAGQPANVRRTLLKDSMNVTVEDIQHVVKVYLSKFFDPQQSCVSLLAGDQEEQTRLVGRLEEIGYKMENADLLSLCTNL